MSTFNFSILNTKIPHDKQIHVLNKITDLAFKGGTRDYVTIQEHFGHSPKVKLEDYSLQGIKSCLEFLIKTASSK